MENLGESAIGGTGWYPVLAVWPVGIHIRNEMKVKVVLFALALAGCAGSAPIPVTAAPPEATVHPVAEQPSPPNGALWREDVVSTVNEGLGAFLQHVDVEPRLEYGEFRGWTITELRPKQFWSGVDLRPGDVVTSVNNMPIERDTQAFEAFQALKSASQLTIVYQRGPETRTLSYKILPRGGSDAPKKAAFAAESMR